MSLWIIILTALCFLGGFALSWLQMRKRIERRYRERLVEEVHKRVAEEMLRRVTSGEVGQGKNAGKSPGKTPDRVASGDPPP